MLTTQNFHSTHCAVAGIARDLVVRLSVTPRCQLRCTYCLPARGCGDYSQTERETLTRAELVRLLAVLHAECGIRRVRFTGGEPLLRRDLAELIAEVRPLGIAELALTTNAQLLAPRADALRAAGLQRVNVSLDSLRPEVFAAVTRGGVLSRTLDGIRAAQAAGLGPVKLNMVVLRGANDGEVGEMLQYALRTGCHLRFLELMPVGEAAERFAGEFVPVDEIQGRLRALGWEWRECPWDPAETSRDFVVRDSEGRETVCGFISPTSHPFCAACRRVRLTSDGWLHSCLAREGRHDLKPLLRLPEAEARAQVRQLMTRVMAEKQGVRFKHTVESMAIVGG